MSGNAAITNEQNTKALAMINKVASDFVKEDNHVKKQKLRSKLWEKCLAYLLHLDITQQDDDLRERINSSLIDNENRLSDENPDLRKTLNMDVFISTMTSVIETYSEKPGEEFTRLFLTTYYIRKNGSVGEEGFKNKIRGFSNSEDDGKMWCSFNKLIDEYFTKDPRFAHKQLHMLSPTDIHTILDEAGVGFEKEKRYVEIARQYAKANGALELDNIIGDDGEKLLNYKVAGSLNVEKDVVDQMYMINLFHKVIELASKIQKQYFKCFITLDLFNNYDKKAFDKMSNCINDDFLNYINSMVKPSKKVPDVVIADFLKVQKPAVTKQRYNFCAVLKKARESLR